MSSVTEKPTVNSCTYCQDVIVGLRIKCMECADFDICLQCFIAGAEIGPHKNIHDYKFVDSVSVVFGPRGWKASELIDLLNAVEYRGFGNWDDIAKEIKTRTADEAREEYISRFLEGTIGKVTWEDVLKNNTVQIIDMTEQLTSEGPLATLSKGGPQIHIAREKANQIGYMPLRDDFEWEYENNAESVVSGLIHLDDNTDVDTTLKLVHIDMYINKLRERARRKRVVKDFQLIPKFFNAQLLPETKSVKRKLNKDDSSECYATTLEQQMRKFSQFHTALEHSQFLDNLIREHRLRRRLAELYRYRMNGIKTIQDCDVFEELSPEGGTSNGTAKTSQSGSCAVSGHIQIKERSEEDEFFSIVRKFMSPIAFPGTSSLSAEVTSTPPSSVQLSLSFQQQVSSSACGEPETLLSEYEIQLSRKLNLSPDQFHNLKTIFLVELNTGRFNRTRSRSEPEQGVINYILAKRWSIMG